MLRKTIIAVAAAATIGALAPSVASAAPRHHGWRHGFNHSHGFHLGGLRIFRPQYGGCWSLVPTRFGFAKVWTCG